MISAMRNHKVVTALVVVGLILLAIFLIGLPGSDTVETSEGAVSPDLTEVSAEHPGFEEVQTGTYDSPSKTKCKTVWESITFNSFFGTDLAKTQLYVYFCWNNDRVTQHSPELHCDVTSAGGLSQWHTERCNKSGFWKRFGGANQGAWQENGEAHYQQTAAGFVVNNHYNYPKIVVFSNGGVQFP